MSRVLSISAVVVLFLVAAYTTEGAKFGGWRPTKGPRAQKGGGGDMGMGGGMGGMGGMPGGGMGGMPPGGAMGDGMGDMGGMGGGAGGQMPPDLAAGGGMPGGGMGGMPGGMGGGMGGQQGQNQMDEDAEENADGYDFDKMGPPGQNGGSKPQIDKCLKSVLKFCPMYRMEANFADFINCVVDHRTRVRSDCFDWAENHSPCAAEIQRLCNAKNPPKTTECIYEQRDQFGQKCRESEFMTTLIEGWAQFKENNEAYGGKPAEGNEDYASKSGDDYDELPDKNAAGGGSGSEGDL